jgi:hypothetical protein
MFKKWLPVMVVLGAALPAGATTTYNTVSSMQTANPGLTFTPVDLSVLQTLSASPSYSLNGVGFAASSNNLTYQVSPPTGWSGITMRGTDNGSSITITLPTGATAFGGIFGGVGGSFGTVTLSGIGDAGSFSQDIAFNTPQYWGFVSNTAITSITLSVTAGTAKPGLNNFVFGLPTSTGGGGDTGGTTTPEPSSLALMGGALIAIPILARRRRK